MKNSLKSTKWALFKESKISKIERVRIELWWKSHCCFANIVRNDLANTFSAWFFKTQNYCDNKSISVVFATLNCAHSTLQCWLDEWKSYVIVDWDTRCETTVQITKIERNIFANILDDDLTQIWQRHNLSSYKTIAIMNSFLLFLQRWIAHIRLYNSD